MSDRPEFGVSYYQNYELIEEPQYASLIQLCGHETFESNNPSIPLAILFGYYPHHAFGWMVNFPKIVRLIKVKHNSSIHIDDNDLAKRGNSAEILVKNKRRYDAIFEDLAIYRRDLIARAIGPGEWAGHDVNLQESYCKHIGEPPLF